MPEGLITYEKCLGEGMSRFRERVAETAGIYNTVGFTDDTRAFPSVPARHDLARRIDANFMAGKLVTAPGQGETGPYAPGFTEGRGVIQLRPVQSRSQPG